MCGAKAEVGCSAIGHWSCILHLAWHGVFALDVKKSKKKKKKKKRNKFHKIFFILNFFFSWSFAPDIPLWCIILAAFHESGRSIPFPSFLPFFSPFLPSPTNSKEYLLFHIRHKCRKLKREREKKEIIKKRREFLLQFAVFIKWNWKTVFLSAPYS